MHAGVCRRVPAATCTTFGLSSSTDKSGGGVSSRDSMVMPHIELGGRCAPPPVVYATLHVAAIDDALLAEKIDGQQAQRSTVSTRLALNGCHLETLLCALVIEKSI